MMRDVGVIESQQIASTAPFVHPQPVEGQPVVDAIGHVSDVEVTAAVVVMIAVAKSGLF
jgi:hypothetical protein